MDTLRVEFCNGTMGDLPDSGSGVYIILETQRDSHGEYIPCIVVPGERGYHLTDWHWGTDYRLAQSIADDKNARMGYTPEQVQKIIIQSMFH